MPYWRTSGSPSGFAALAKGKVRVVIPRVGKGGSLASLLSYLCSTASPRDARANQHVRPHVVGGDPFLQALWDGVDLSQPNAECACGRSAAADIAAYLDRPRRVFGTEIMAGVWEWDKETGERRRVLDAAGEPVMRDTHVWHCSLSLAPGEVLSDEQWATVTDAFMDRMGFTGPAPSRWVAIEHGPGRGGKDHVHVVASMVREDGERWAGNFADFGKAQRTCRELETRHGLVRVGEQA